MLNALLKYVLDNLVSDPVNSQHHRGHHRDGGSCPQEQGGHRHRGRAVNEPSQSFTLKAPNSVFAIKNPPSILIFSIVKALAGALNKEEALVSAFSGHCKNSRRFVDSFSVQCVHVAVSGSAVAGLLTSARLSVKLPARPTLSWPRLYLNVRNSSKNVR